MRLLDGNKFTIGYRNPFVGGGDDPGGERGTRAPRSVSCGPWTWQFVTAHGE